jgi:hypothetical protein
MTPPETVSHEEVEKISALSPAHRLTVQEFLDSGRWMLKGQVGGTAPGAARDHATAIRS